MAIVRVVYVRKWQSSTLDRVELVDE